MSDKNQKKKSKKKWLIPLAVVVLIGGFIGFQFMKIKNAAPLVTSGTIGYNDVESFISLSGTVDSGENGEFIITGNTEVADVHVKVGDKVEAGDLLVSFNHTNSEKAFRNAQIQYDQVRLQILDSAASYHDRMVDYVEAKEDLRVMKQDNVTEAVYDAQAERVRNLKRLVPTDEALQQEQLRLENATIALRTATEDYNSLPANIYADGAGVVEYIGVKKLSQAMKGTVAATIKYTDADTVTVKVGKYDLPRIEEGQSAVVKIGKQQYNGVVSSIGTVAEAGNVDIKVKVSDPDRLFIVGLDGDVDILTYRNSNVLTIPVESVKSDREGSYCYVLTPVGKENTYTYAKTYIEVGNSSDVYTEVLSGLNEGDKVVTAPPSTIEYFQLVKLA